MTQLTIGIDIGGTNTTFGFVDRQGKVFAKGAIPTQEQELVEDYISDLTAIVKKEISNLPVDYEIVGIGIGAPNGNFYNGTIEYAPNLRWEGIINIVELFKQQFDVPAFLTNDANAAAIGEMIYGGARYMKNFIMITLGTGVGSGIVVNGELVYGHDGFAGEIGHVIVDEKGRACSCGRKGCLETYCSAPGIKRTALELIAKSGNGSALKNIPPDQLNSKDVAIAASEGDKLSLKVFKETGKVLGKALANTVAYLSPKAIFLFGGPSQAGDLIFKPTKKYMEENLLTIFKNKVEILPSQLPAGDAAIVGASALAWKELSK